MADFVSEFWNWFIIIPTVLGLVGCVWLARANSKKPSKIEATDHVWDEDLREYNNPLPRWWLNLFYITLVFSAVYLVLYPGLGTYQGLLGWSETSQYQAEVADAEARFGPLYERYAGTDIEKLIVDAEAMRTGANLFSTYCTTCHGSDARGATGFPNLRDQDWLYGGEPAVIKTTILKGRTGVMPPWGAALGEEGVHQVVEYVRSLSGKGEDLAAVAAGKARFQAMCASCHGAEGKGNPQIGAPNLTDDYWLYGGSTRAIRQTIAEGRQGRMPPHEEFLGEAKVHLLAAYIYSLTQKSTGK